jgi:hypothetical protein
MAKFYVPAHNPPDRLKRVEPSVPLQPNAHIGSLNMETKVLLARIDYHAENPDVKLDVEPRFIGPSDANGSFSRKSSRGLDK